MAKPKIEYEKCPKCGKDMPKGSTFCSACGEKIEEPKIEFITCKHCGNLTPSLSIFCMNCGSQLKKTKKQKEKKEGYIPEPKKKPSGNWFIQLRIGKKSYCITKPTYEECKAEAKAIKIGIMEAKQKKKVYTLKQVCRKYIDERKNVLSPATVRGYEQIVNHRFQKYMNKDITDINYQKMIDEESLSAQTVTNSWQFVKCAIDAVDENAVPKKILLPQIIRKELPWLTSEQIPTFLEAIKGSPWEIGILLGLHGLRRSELLAVTPEKIYDGFIHVEGSKVYDKDGNLIRKETNKNRNSRRQVPILIPRLLEILSDGDYKDDEVLVKSDSNLFKYISKICKKNNLPEVGIHGLRRSFVSLCYSQGISERVCMSWGGWSNIITMHNNYIKISKNDNENSIEKIKAFYEHNATENATKIQEAQ